jgi:FlaG/FlaF family flagellin (archaellin)
MNEERMTVEREDAVSPVVGVMLMLVVVIIIAAVVSAFAGGLAKTSDKAPQVSLDVKIDSVENKMTFTHLSGDTLNTKDLTIITYFTNPSGYTYKHTQTASSNATVLYTSGNDARVPYNADMFRGYAHSNPETKDFGNFTLKTGDIMSSGNIRGTADLIGLGWTAGSPDTFNDPSFKSGSIVNVKILHKPSGKTIFDKDVIVS